MKFLSGTCATAIIAAVAVTSTFPTAHAAPLFLPTAQSVHSDVIQIRDGWYNGYRGFRKYRRGYRHRDGFWFPAGAFITGAIIGGAIANSNAYYGDRYYADPYYVDPYYVDPYYGGGRRYYYDNGTYNQYSSGGIPCTFRAEDAGLC